MRNGPLALVVVATLLIAACATEEISLLDRELMIYKVEHEGKRYEDLEKELAAEQEKADVVAEVLLEARARREELTLELQVELEDLRKQEDSLRKAVAAARKKVEALKREKAALDAAAKPPPKKPAPQPKPPAKPPAKAPAKPK
jgi:FtsZ-binding cell division protein ZapB